MKFSLLSGFEQPFPQQDVFSGQIDITMTTINTKFQSKGKIWRFKDCALKIDILKYEYGIYIFPE